MIDIKIFEQQQGMMVTYVCRSLDARIATQLYVFWDEYFPRDRLQQLDWLVIDLSEVSLMDASGVATLVHVFQQLRAGISLHLLGCNADIMQLMTDLRLQRLFPQHANIGTLPNFAQSLQQHPETHYQSHRLRVSWVSKP